MCDKRNTSALYLNKNYATKHINMKFEDALISHLKY